MNYSQYKKIPVYEKLWQENHIPILNKEDIRSNFPHNWFTPEVKQAVELGDVEWVASSGTTSERMQIMRPKNWRFEQLEKTYSQHDTLKRCWNEQYTRIALTTAICSQTLCFKEDPGPEKRFIGRTLYINLSSDPQTWVKSDLERMLKEIAGYTPYFLDVDPYYLAIFLKKLKQYGLLSKLVEPEAITFGYEFTTKNIRQYIKNTLAVSLLNLYGSTELGYLFMENEQGQMRLCSEQTAIELIPLDSDKKLYSLVVSCTKNPYMPLIRYRTGDCLQMDSIENTSEIIRICGREKETLTGVGGVIPQAFVDDLIHDYATDILIYQLQELGEYKLQLCYTTMSDTPIAVQIVIELEKQIAMLAGKDCVLQYRSALSPGFSGKFSWLRKENEG